MMLRILPGWLLFNLGLAAVLVTRIPGETPVLGIVGPVLAGLASLLALLGSWPRPRSALRAAAAVSALALLLVPVTMDAFDDSLRAAGVALVLLVGMHAMFLAPRRAPRLITDAPGEHALRSLLRFVPSLLAFAAIGAVTMVGPRVVPERIRYAAELQSPLLPLLALAVLAAPLVVIGAVRSAILPSTAAAPDEAPGPDTSTLHTEANLG